MTSSTVRCRSVLLLQKELFKINQSKVWGIEVEPMKCEDDDGEEDVFCWNVLLSGLKKTPWKGGRFKIVMEFDKDFDAIPPRISFARPIPQHPNVSTTDGQVCLGCLEEWKPNTSLASVLISIQQLLSEPWFEKAWNEDAVHIAMETPKQYKQMVLDNVMNSKRGLVVKDPTPAAAEKETSPKHKTITFKEISSPTLPANKKSSERLSYESYLYDWRSLGTTHDEIDANTVTKELNKKLDMSEGSLQESMSEKIFQQLSDHRKITYGSFNSTTEDEKAVKRAQLLKDNKIKLLKDLHSNKKGIKSLRVSLPTSPANSPVEDLFDESNQVTESPNEIEAQQLLEWSQKLPEKHTS